MDPRPGEWPAWGLSPSILGRTTSRGGGGGMPGDRPATFKPKPLGPLLARSGGKNDSLDELQQRKHHQHKPRIPRIHTESIFERCPTARGLRRPDLAMRAQQSAYRGAFRPDSSGEVHAVSSSSDEIRTARIEVRHELHTRRRLPALGQLLITCLWSSLALLLLVAPGSSPWVGASAPNVPPETPPYTPPAASLLALKCSSVEVCDSFHECDLIALVSRCCRAVSLVSEPYGVRILLIGDHRIHSSVDVTCNVTIYGQASSQPASIRAVPLGQLARPFRIFDVSPGMSLFLADVALRRGRSLTDTMGGGAILVRNDAELSLDRVAFFSNSAASGDGGAIAAQRNAVVSANDCLFDQNWASEGDGGAIAVQSSAWLKIRNTTFTHNNAFFSGGALKVSNTSLAMSHSRLSGNAAQKGGALACLTSTGAISKTVMTGNIATFGGGIHCLDCATTIVASKFVANSANEATSQSIYVHRASERAAGATVPALFVLDTSFEPRYSSDISHINSLLVYNENGEVLRRQSPVSRCGAKPLRAPTPYDDAGVANAGCGASGVCVDDKDALNGTVHVIGRCKSCGADAGFPQWIRPEVEFNACNRELWAPLERVLSAPWPCTTTGGYVPEDTPCHFPFFIPGAESNKPHYSCIPFGVSGGPFIGDSSPPRGPLSPTTYWCGTAEPGTLTPGSPQARRAWGYCRPQCGNYATGELDPTDDESDLPEGAVPTREPTTAPSYARATAYPTSKPAASEPPGGGPTASTGAPTTTPAHLLTKPVMRSAQYTGAGGSTIEVHFSLDTDCGGLCRTDVDVALWGSTFPCSRVLLLPSDSTEECAWESPDVFLMFPTKPHDEITLLGVADISDETENVIRARGEPEGPWAEGSVRVSLGSSLEYPVVTLVASSEVTRCGSSQLEIDGAATVVSTIGGVDSAEWFLRQVEPYTPEASLEAVRAALERCTATRSLYCAPGTLPAPGIRYSFGLRVTNAFQMSSVATVVVEVAEDPPLRGAKSSLTVSFAGGSMMTVTLPKSNSSNGVRINAIVQRLGACSESDFKLRTMEPPQLTWAIVGTMGSFTGTSNAKGHPALVPSATDPSSAMFYPARLGLDRKQSLPIDVTLRLTARLAATPGNSAKTATGNIIVRILETPLVLAIDTPVVPVLSTSRELLRFQGSVVSGGRFDQEQVDFEWKCSLRTSTSPGAEACVIVGWSTSFETPWLSDLLVRPDPRALQYDIVFTARSALVDRRSSAQFVLPVNWNATDEAEESIDSLLVGDSPVAATGTRWNIGDTLRAEASCRPASTNRQLNRHNSHAKSALKWRLVQKGFGIDVSNHLVSLKSAAIAPPRTLAEGFSYALIVECSASRGVMKTADIVINRAPRGGVVQVSPSSGDVFTTMFAMRAMDFIDDEGDLPLTYSFEWSSSELPPTLFSRPSSYATLSAFIPLGASRVGVRALDSLGAASSPRVVDVHVTGSDDPSSSALAWFALAAQRWTNDLDKKTWQYQRSGSEILSEAAIGASIVSLLQLSSTSALLQSNETRAEVVRALARVIVHQLSVAMNKFVVDAGSLDAYQSIVAHVVRTLSPIIDASCVLDILEGTIATSDEFSMKTASVSSALTVVTRAVKRILQTSRESSEGKLENERCAMYFELRSSEPVGSFDHAVSELLLETLCSPADDARKRRGLGVKKRPEKTESTHVWYAASRVLKRVASSVLMGAIPGEPPVVASSVGDVDAAVTFAAWRVDGVDEDEPKDGEERMRQSTTIDAWDGASFELSDRDQKQEVVWIAGWRNVTWSEFWTPNAKLQTILDNQTDFDNRWYHSIAKRSFAIGRGNTGFSARNISLHDGYSFVLKSHPNYPFANHSNLPLRADSVVLSARGHLVVGTVVCLRTFLPTSAPTSSLEQRSGNCKVVVGESNVSCLCDRVLDSDKEENGKVASEGRLLIEESDDDEEGSATLSVVFADLVTVSDLIELGTANPATGPPTRNGASTRSPTQGTLIPLPSKTNADTLVWAACLVVLCTLLIVGSLSLIGNILDRRDSDAANRRLLLGATMQRLTSRRLKRRAFHAIRDVVRSGVELSWVDPVDEFFPPEDASAGPFPEPDKSVSLAQLLLELPPKRAHPDLEVDLARRRSDVRAAFFRRHAWTAPLIGFDPRSPRPTRTPLLLAVFLGNLGVCAAMMSLFERDYFLAGLISAPIVAVLTLAVDVASALVCGRPSKRSVAKHVTRTWRSRLGVLFVAAVGAAMAIAFIAVPDEYFRFAGKDGKLQTSIFSAWMEAVGTALLLDVLVAQPCLALLRLMAMTTPRRSGTVADAKKPLSPESPARYDSLTEYEWRRVELEELLDGGSVCSLDTNAQARDLIQLIFGGIPARDVAEDRSHRDLLLGEEAPGTPAARRRSRSSSSPVHFRIQEDMSSLSGGATAMTPPRDASSSRLFAALELPGDDGDTDVPDAIDRGMSPFASSVPCVFTGSEGRLPSDAPPPVLIALRTDSHPSAQAPSELGTPTPRTRSRASRILLPLHGRSASSVASSEHNYGEDWISSHPLTSRRGGTLSPPPLSDAPRLASHSGIEDENNGAADDEDVDDLADSAHEVVRGQRTHSAPSAPDASHGVAATVAGTQTGTILMESSGGGTSAQKQQQRESRQREERVEAVESV